MSGLRGFGIIESGEQTRGTGDTGEGIRETDKGCEGMKA